MALTPKSWLFWNLSWILWSFNKVSPLWLECDSKILQHCFISVSLFYLQPHSGCFLVNLAQSCPVHVKSNSWPRAVKSPTQTLGFLTPILWSYLSTRCPAESNHVFSPKMWFLPSYLVRPLALQSYAMVGKLPTYRCQSEYGTHLMSVPSLRDHSLIQSGIVEYLKTITSCIV